MPEPSLAAVLAASPSPTSPDTSQGTPKGLDPNSVTPGIEGFLAIFVIVVATIFLIRSMVRHLRGIRYRAERSGEVPGSQALPEQAPQPRPQRPTRAVRSAAPPLGPAPPPGRGPTVAGDGGPDGQEQIRH